MALSPDTLSWIVPTGNRLTWACPGMLTPSPKIRDAPRKHKGFVVELEWINPICEILGGEDCPGGQLTAIDAACRLPVQLN